MKKIRLIGLWSLLIFGGTFAPIIAIIDWTAHYLDPRSRVIPVPPVSQFLSGIYRDLHLLIESADF